MIGLVIGYYGFADNHLYLFVPQFWVAHLIHLGKTMTLLLLIGIFLH